MDILWLAFPCATEKDETALEEEEERGVSIVSD
jgi:hypothetical protein